MNQGVPNYYPSIHAITGFLETFIIFQLDATQEFKKQRKDLAFMAKSFKAKSHKFDGWKRILP